MGAVLSLGLMRAFHPFVIPLFVRGTILRSPNVLQLLRQSHTCLGFRKGSFRTTTLYDFVLVLRISTKFYTIYICHLYTYVSHTHTVQKGHLYARTLQQKSPACSCNPNTPWKILRIETLSSSFSSSSPRFTPSLQGLGFRVMLGMSLNVLKANTQAGRIEEQGGFLMPY